MHKIEILETTLRDGSYSVNNQFTAEDTYFIAKSLDEIGFNYIEIGSGIGMNAKSKTNITPASEDIAYIKSARKAVKNGKIGMFFIPGIGRVEDIDLAADEGLDFLRIGVNITEIDKAFTYLNHCRKKNLITTLNLMKSYAVDSNELVEIASKCYDNGVEILYIVDSAGGMLPSEVEEYVVKVKEKLPNLKLGFHGHDNLSLSMANTLAAINAGADFVDSTIRGIGRSSGNTITEKLLLIIDRLGYKHNFDLDKLFNISEHIILPYLSNKFESSTDYILGYSQFHSSYLNSVYKISKKYNVDLNKLIVNYSKIDKISMDEDLLEQLAIKLSKVELRTSYFNIASEIKHNENTERQLSILKNKFIELKNKYNSLVFFNLSKSYESISRIKVSPVVHTIEDIVFGSAELSFKDFNYNKLIDYFKATVDGFLVDRRILNNISDLTSHNDIQYYYNDAIMFAKSIYNYLKNIKLHDTNKLNKLYIDIYDEVLVYLIELIKDLNVTITSNINDANIAVVGKNFVESKVIDECKDLKWILLTTPKKLDYRISENNSNVTLIRIDLEREIFSEIIENINYKRLFNEGFGQKLINGKLYCSGGFIGRKGSIVVDNMNKISKIYGSSNGDGSISYTKNKSLSHDTLS
ncbi:hypothetical protein [Wukongibacter sp. M2B1]|uniref:hypothetical protein n=1 Tax=Wukongibacter sp. M2B1 TaxID=3088895 RepID=UPI003D7A55A8